MTLLRWRGLTLAVPALAICLIAIACGGNGDNGDATPTPPGPGNGGTPPPTATPAPTDAFLMYRDNLGDLLAMDMQTQEVFRRQFDFTQEIALTAECTADGSKIAYLRQDFDKTEREVVIADASGEWEPIALPGRSQGITWSPEGDRLAVTDFHPTEGFSLWMLDIETGTLEQIAGGQGFAGSPRWSPDGSAIAYHLQGDFVRLFVYELDTREARPVTDGTLNTYDPEWSHTSNSVLYIGLDANGIFQVYSLDLETGQHEQITSSDVFKRFPRFSPDGQVVAYTGSIVVPSVSLMAAPLHSFGIFLMNPDGSGERALTADPRDSDDPQANPELDAFLLGWCAPGPWLDDAWEREE